MKTSALARWVTAGSACWMLSGCIGPFERFADKPPAPPRGPKWRSIETLDLPQASAAEVKAVTAQQAAKVNYRYRLGVLEGYFVRSGDMTKANWARREIKNLDDVQTFVWVGLPPITAPKGESIENADENALVEDLTAVRKEYLAATEALRRFYQGGGDPLKERLVANMQERLDPVRLYHYFIMAEVPAGTLRPTAVIPAADALYGQAYQLYRSARVLPAITDYPKMKKALVLFLKLVDENPTSNKIAASAYYIAEIYKEYFREHVRAVHWYRRAWQWDPNLPLPARFQAATIYDFHLQNNRQAVACYRGCIEHEQFNVTNVQFANRRITELTAKPEQ